MTTPVAIIGGTGALGTGLALRLARAGRPVVVGSREAARAASAADAVRHRLPDADVRGLDIAGATAAADVAIVTVPFANQVATLEAMREGLGPGDLVIDATVPLATATGGRPTALLGVWEGSAAQQARNRLADEIGLAAALHTVNAGLLADLDHELAEDTLVCGAKADRARAIELLGEIVGLRPVDAGPLGNARHVEGITPLLIGINSRYKAHAGVRFTGLA